MGHISARTHRRHNRIGVIFLYAALFPLLCHAEENSLHYLGKTAFYIDGAHSTQQPQKLPAAKLSRAREAHSLGQVLEVLGPAYMRPGESAGLVHWYFDDGEILTAWPHGNETPEDAVSFHFKSGCPNNNPYACAARLAIKKKR